MGGLYLLVFVIILGVHESLSRCPLGWYHHGNSCLLFSTDTLNWNDSSEACASVGASLVAIESHEEETFIQNRLHHEFVAPSFIGGRENSDTMYLGGDHRPSASKQGNFLSLLAEASFMFWLGGTDQFQSDSVWYWISTEQAINNGYTDWHATEPDHPGKQHCLAMRKDLNYQWCDDYCPELHAYICEKPLDDGQSIIG